MPRFFQRRTLWIPTLPGLFILFVSAAFPTLGWWLGAEPFLTRTQRENAEVLVVEGWIGIEGVHAARAEFEGGGYAVVVASGGHLGTRWDQNRWNAAIEAGKVLRKAGVDPSRIVEAPAEETASNRSYAAALAVRHALERLGLHPKAVNVFTQGVHARRSRLIYARVLGSNVRVGSIAWVTSEDREGPWWQSSERAQELLKETIAYPFELLLHSGRWWSDTKVIRKSALFLRVPTTQTCRAGSDRLAVLEVGPGTNSPNISPPPIGASFARCPL